MTVGHAAIDLDDGPALLAADGTGLLRSAALAGAQARAMAAAVEEGAVESLRGDPARTLIWLAGRGTAGSAGALLAATPGGAAGVPIVLAAEVPTWVGPLDVLVVAGDDPGDPVLVAGAATGVRRGARVVVAAPHEGPLRDVTAGRAVVLAPRVAVPEEFRLVGAFAAGLAVLAAVDPRLRTDLAGLADALDGEALRSGPARETFTNPAKTLAERLRGGGAALVGDDAATLAVARHASATLLRVARTAVAAGGLADAVAAGHADPAAGDSIFHDEEIDGPAPARLRVLALTLTEHRTVAAARIGGLADIDLVSADAPTGEPVGMVVGMVEVPVEQQLAMLAVRLELAAVYLRLCAERQG